MRTIKAPNVRRQEILDAAIGVFTEKGYEKTSITDIAQACGVSQGLCYRYFPSKEAIYDAAIDEYAEYIVQKNRARTHLDGKTLKEQIYLISGRLGEYSDAEKGEQALYALFHKPGNRKLHDQLFLRTSQKLVPVLAQMLRDACARGEIHLSDPEAAAYFFVFGQMGLLMSPGLTEQEKTARIQTCLVELLGL